MSDEIRGHRSYRPFGKPPETCHHHMIDHGQVCPVCKEEVRFMLGNGSRMVTRSELSNIARESARQLKAIVEANPDFFRDWKPEVIQCPPDWNETNHG